MFFEKNATCLGSTRIATRCFQSSTQECRALGFIGYPCGSALYLHSASALALFVMASIKMPFEAFTQNNPQPIPWYCLLTAITIPHSSSVRRGPPIPPSNFASNNALWMASCVYNLQNICFRTSRLNMPMVKWMCSYINLLASLYHGVHCTVAMQGGGYLQEMGTSELKEWVTSESLDVPTVRESTDLCLVVRLSRSTWHTPLQGDRLA